MGGGYSTWRGIDLTRWQADGVLDSWGTWIYIQDMDLTQREDGAARSLWSVGFQPIPAKAENMQVTFFAHMAVFHRVENDITSTMEVTVSPDDPVEIRRIHLHNTDSLAAPTAFDFLWGSDPHAAGCRQPPSRFQQAVYRE